MSPAGRSLGRAQQLGGPARVDHHVALIVEAVFGGERPRAVDQRQPLARAVVAEARDIERAVVENVGIGRRIAPSANGHGNELV